MKISVLLLFSFLAFQLNAQVKIGNNPTVIMNGSLLEMEHVPGSPKALTLPRVTGIEMNTIPSPSRGMLVYNTDSTCVCYFNGSAWRSVCATGDFWRLAGNGSTSPGTNGIGFSTDANFWGTKDNNNLVVGTNNIKRAIYDGQGNYYGGFGTVLGPTTLTHNINAPLAFGNFVWGLSDTISAGGAIQTYGNLITGTQNKYTPIENQAGQTIIGGYNNKVSAGNTIVSGDDNKLGGFGPGVGSGIVVGNRNIVGWDTRFNNAVTAPAVFGQQNTDSSDWTFVAGLGNTISTNCYNSAAIGTSITLKPNSFQSYGIGSNINVSNSGNVAIADVGATPLTSSSDNEFNARFSGGYRLFTNTGLTTGVFLGPGSTSWASISDRRSKSHIGNLEYGLASILALSPISYRYLGNTQYSLGFIAQDVERIIPEVVEKTHSGPTKDYLAVKYQEIIPILTKAIQEQQLIINDLIKRIDALESK